MSLLEHFKSAFNIIILNKLRSGLSMLGIIIGVASVVIMVAIGQGAQQSITSRIQALGSNLITITPGAQRNTNVRIESAGWNNSTKVLTLDHADAIKSEVPDVTAIASEMSNRKQVIYWKNNTNTSIKWVTPEYEEVRNFKVNFGQFISEESVRSSDKVAVLGVTVVKNLFEGENPLGKDIIIGDRIFTVIGVMEEKATGNTDDVIFIPLTTAQRVLFGSEYLTTIAISVSDSKKMTEVKNTTEQILMQKLGLKSVEDQNFTITNQADTLSAVGDVSKILTVFLWGIAAISLLVGGIGVMNIMLVSVTERTHEIGIRKAIGATKKDILTQFLTESLVLSVLGGTFGVLLSYGAVWWVNKSGALSAIISTNSIVLAFGFSAFIGILFGMLPAYKAGKLKPIDALRFE